jgi:ketosteroid isomerase-like protein
MVTAGTHSSLTKAEVDSAVRAYWKAVSLKDAVQQQNFYDEHAAIFATDSNRLEPARAVLLRRQREYLNAATKMAVQVGEVEIALVGSRHAIAAYTIRLDAKYILRTSPSGSTSADEHLEHVRITQLFGRQNDGTLRIVHEHVSAPLG